MPERIPALKREAPAARRKSGKLLAIVVALFVIVLVVLFFRSPLSRIQQISITGNAHLTRAEVMQALKVNPGDSFFFPGSGQLEKRVLALKPVKSVRVRKHFPGMLAVEVQEYPEVAVYVSEQGKFSVLLANGQSVPALAGGLPDKPVLTGWKPDNPYLGALCKVLAGMPEGLISDLSEIVPNPSSAYPDRITLYTRSRFEVLTTVGKLKDKIPFLDEIVDNREPGKVVMLEADTYMPYSAQNASENASEPDKHKEKDSTQ
jgi:cell division protein FtsQ